MSADIKNCGKKIEKLVVLKVQSEVSEEEFLKITEELALSKDFLKRLTELEKKIKDTEWHCIINFLLSLLTYLLVIKNFGLSHPDHFNSYLHFKIVDTENTF